MSYPQRSLMKYGVVGALALAAAGLLGSVSGAGVQRVDAKVADGSSATATAAARAFRMPSAGRCVRAGRLRLRIVPPNDDGLSTVRVQMDGRDRVRLRGVFTTTTVYMNLPSGRTPVKVMADSDDDGRLVRSRSYRRCSGATTPSTRPAIPPIVYEGGGED